MHSTYLELGDPSSTEVLQLSNHSAGGPSGERTHTFLLYLHFIGSAFARNDIAPADRVLRWGDRDMLQPSDLDTGEKEKEKIFYDFFLLFVEEDSFYSFLPLEQRVELRIDLAGTTTLWKNQDVT